MILRHGTKKSLNKITLHLHRLLKFCLFNSLKCQVPGSKTKIRLNSREFKNNMSKPIQRAAHTFTFCDPSSGFSYSCYGAGINLQTPETCLSKVIHHSEHHDQINYCQGYFTIVCTDVIRLQICRAGMLRHLSLKQALRLCAADTRDNLWQAIAEVVTCMTWIWRFSL